MPIAIASQAHNDYGLPTRISLTVSNISITKEEERHIQIWRSSLRYML